MNLSELNPKNEEHLELLWLIAKEGWQKARIGEYHTQRQAMSRFSVGAVVLSDPVIDIIRRELRRVSPGVRIDTDELRKVLTSEVIKREVIEGDKADEARKMKDDSPDDDVAAPPPPDAPVSGGGSPAEG